MQTQLFNYSVPPHVAPREALPHAPDIQRSVGRSG